MTTTTPDPIEKLREAVGRPGSVTFNPNSPLVRALWRNNKDNYIPRRIAEIAIRLPEATRLEGHTVTIQSAPKERSWIVRVDSWGFRGDHWLSALAWAVTFAVLEKANRAIPERPCDGGYCGV